MSVDVMSENDIATEAAATVEDILDDVERSVSLEKYQELLLGLKNNIDQRLSFCLAKSMENDDSHECSRCFSRFQGGQCRRCGFVVYGGKS